MNWKALTAILTAVFLLAGCGTKKNTALSRNWQAFTTRYNVYFNGSEHYIEQLKAMEDAYEDDYTRNLLVHPAEARADSKMTQPTGDFKRTIEKMEKAIQLHSITKKPAKRSNSPEDKAFRARDEFNPFLHNAWLMLGKAQYFDGDFLKAAATFLYITRHFTWLPDVVTEARLWQARSFCAMGWIYETENAMHLVKEKDLTDGSLRHLYNLVEGDFMLRQDKYAEAVNYLREAARTASGMQRHRLWFLVGQLYSRLSQNELAYEAFGKAGAGMSTPYRTKFNARIKQSEVFTGSNIRKEVSALRGMARYQRNSEYLDQIYYAIGNLCLSRGDSTEAADNYRTAVEKSTRNGIDKALAQIALGGIYFDWHEYLKAQPCYSEAVAQLPDNYPGYKKLRQRSDVLDELSVYANNVHLQDSLLTLAAMTPEQQRQACQRLVDRLLEEEKKAREAAEAAERAAQVEAMEGQNDRMAQNAPTTPSVGMNTDKSWYFYNQMTRQQGKTEFQRRWGARKLEDDWRRRNKATFSLEEEPSEEEEDSVDNDEGSGNGDEGLVNSDDQTGTTADSLANDPHNVEYYLRQIPKTPEEIQTSNDIVQEGLYNMGLILKDHLEDYRAASVEFERLLDRYPDNVYRLDVYYNMYLMAVREDNKTLAETWRQKIIADFPDSPYGQAMRDPDYFDNLRRMHEVQEEMYAEAYEAYLADDNPKVHSLTGDMERLYPLSPVMPKFVFIDALSYLTEGETGRFKDRLTELLQRWPDTDMTDMASGILKRLREGWKPETGGSNARGMVWNIKLGDGSGEDGEEGEESGFTMDPDAPQYVVLVFPTDSVNPNLVLYEVARFNFSSFVVRDFDLEPMSFSTVGLLVVKGFRNLHEAEVYRDRLDAAGLEFGGEVRPVIISKDNFGVLLSGGKSFEDYFRFREEETEAMSEELED